MADENDFPEYEGMTDEEIWEAWQAEKQASYEEDMRALAAGEKTREQLIRENHAVPAHIARAPLDWTKIRK